MSNERISAAEYRLGNLAARESAKERRVRRRGATAPNPYVGMLCELCGQLVKSDSSPAQLETRVEYVGDLGRVAGRTVRHLGGCPA